MTSLSTSISAGDRRIYDLFNEDPERIDTEVPCDVLEAVRGGASGDSEDIAELLAMSEAEYRDIIAESIANGEEDDWITFFSEQLIGRTVKALGLIDQVMSRCVIVIRDLPFQSRKEAAERIRAQREQLHRWLSQARVVRAHRHQVRLERDLTARRNRVPISTAMLLGAAIQRHMANSLARGLQPEPDDLLLWSVLGLIEVPLKEDDVPLKQALGHGPWIANLQDLERAAASSSEACAGGAS